VHCIVELYLSFFGEAALHLAHHLLFGDDALVSVHLKDDVLREVVEGTEKIAAYDGLFEHLLYCVRLEFVHLLYYARYHLIIPLHLHIITYDSSDQYQ
jgi:hypothetical protein